MTPLMSLDVVTLIAYALHVFLSLTMVCVIALILVQCVFRHNPSVRYFVCFTTLFVLLLSPWAIWIQGKARYGLLTVSLPAKFLFSPVPAGQGGPPLPMDAGTNAGVRNVSGAQAGMNQVGWGLLALWAAGVACGVVRLAKGWNAVSRLIRDARPWAAPPSSGTTLEQVECVLGCAISPVFTAPIVSPVVVGVIRPHVILPEALAESATPLQLRHVLLHEGAHVAFRHTFGGVMERIARLLFWPHPLVHVLCQELARAREEVCDNVASQEDGAACYARTLLAIAQGLVAAPNVPSALALLGPGTSLEGRIAGLLNPRRNRMVRVQQWKVWAGTALAVFALAAIVAVRVVASEAKAKQDVAGSSNPSGRLALGDIRADAAPHRQPSYSISTFTLGDIRADVAPLASGQHVEVHKVGANEFELWIGGKKVGLLHGPPMPPTSRDSENAAEEEEMSADSKRDVEIMAAKEMHEAQTRGTAGEAAEIAAKKKALAEARAMASGGQRAKQPTAGASADELLAAKREAEAKARKN